MRRSYRNILLIVSGLISLFYSSQAQINTEATLLWQHNGKALADTHLAFRGTFSLSETTELEMQLCGASWYVIWLDGNYFYEGPDRYSPMYPEYQSKKVKLPKGKHFLAVQVHYDGVDTRMLKAIQPFFYCRILHTNKEIPVFWKCKELEGYENQMFRISAQLGWVEWLDTRKIPKNWNKVDFDDTTWDSPVEVLREIGPLKKSKISEVKSLELFPESIAEGKFAEVYGYEKDNPSARFFLRDLKCEKLPPQGVWKRYDLGKVQLSRPKFILDLPEGAIVEFAYSEFLSHGRVAPWITLSLSDSYNLDHFVARGGKQEFFPLVPKGGRFVEIHIKAQPEKISFMEEKFIVRSYYDKQEGEFQSNDELLNRIWQTGIETYKSCAEDALVDNPTRERGQWLGDFGIVGLSIGSVGFSDVEICRRGLVQSAQCANSDGFVAGLSPGNEAFLSTFSAQWVHACMNYYRFTGDKSIIEDLYSYAQRNIAGFQLHLTKEGLSNDAGWPFVDWGYVPNEGSSDMSLNLHYFIALQEMVEWSKLLNKSEEAFKYETYKKEISSIISRYFAGHSIPEYNWDTIGYHRTVLGMLTGFISKNQNKHGIEYIKQHILNCFPNNPDAPRLSDPDANNPQLITPYFAHYVFPLLIENGEMDFVLDQYRKSWGWALQDNRTTWLEVFDTRWSHCHQWSGCPTWQLSRYVLGLHPTFDKESNSFDFNFHTGHLTDAEGKVPLPDGNVISVKWVKIGNNIEYVLNTSVPVIIHIPKEVKASKNGKVKVRNTLKLVIPNKSE